MYLEIQKSKPQWNRDTGKLWLLEYYANLEVRANTLMVKKERNPQNIYKI